MRGATRPWIRLRAPARPQLPGAPPPRFYRTKAKPASAPSETSSLQAANRLMNVFNSGKPSIGAWQMLPGSNISRVLARSGVDWVLVDIEHDSAVHESVPAIAALGVSPIVRIPDMQGWMVLVPLLRTADEARQLVQSAKFPPRGRRGYGNPFSFERFDPKSTSLHYLQEANEAVLTMVQIETKGALDNIAEIAAVDGIDVLFIGPYDLGNNLGHPMLTADGPPELRAAIADILAAAKKAGKKCGILALDGEQGRRYAAQGFDMISVTLDYFTLDVHTQREVRIAQGSGL